MAWKPTRPKLIETKAELSRLIGCRIETLNRWMREPGFPGDNDGDGWSVWDVVCWKRDKDSPSSLPLFDPEVLDDPDDENALERLRNAPADVRELEARIKWTEERARLAEQKRLENDQTLCSREEIHNVFTHYASLIRRAAEDIQRISGPDAADPLNEALDRAIDEWENRTGETVETD